MQNNEHNENYAEIVEQIQRVQEYSNTLEKHVVDLKTIAESLERCSNLKKDNEILIPIGSGLFCKAMIKNDKIILNVGAGVCLEKTFEEASEIVKKQLDEVSSVLTQVQVNLNYLASKESDLRK